MRYAILLMDTFPTSVSLMAICNILAGLHGSMANLWLDDLYAVMDCHETDASSIDHDVDPEAWFTWVLGCLPDHNFNHINELMSWMWEVSTGAIP